MASYGPNSQRYYFPQQQQQHSPSTTNLLSPHQPVSRSSSTGSAILPKYVRGPPSLRSMTSTSSLSESPYSGVNATVGSRVPSNVPSISDKYSLPPDPAAWGSNLSPSFKEDDDWLHNPDPRRDRKNDAGTTFFTFRGLSNLGCILVLGVGLVALFAGYPLISHFTSTTQSTLGGFNLGGINASGQVPDLPGNWGLIDLDTPKEAYTKPSYFDPKQELQLVFSDEFNTDGRTFYPGDDPYWEAVDLHYWATNNLEWYDPEAITTKNGALEITLSKKETHDLHYQGGMMTTWNKFCFTGGLVEASVTLPGITNVAGLWPAIWTMGNLGRAGYGASLEGMWPYTYDACDVGTAPNQTINGLPVSATIDNDPNNNGALSFLPGQRLSRCTCQGESHPGPVHSDGTYVGRAAPEIDVFEAAIEPNLKIGQVSQSAQWAPYNLKYTWFEEEGRTYTIVDHNITEINAYKGGVFQQATSGLTTTNQSCYELTNRCFSTYGFEYKPGKYLTYISWISDSKIAWTLFASGMAADDRVQIASRPIPQEPMYLIVNLGMSTNFGEVDFEHLTFPTTMRVDWVRVYQPKDAISYGCDPKDFPTKAYIDQYIEAYTNPNLTTWTDDYKQPFPRNKLVDGCL
ncbi:glycoside hydrolase family 16 protein [Amanita thiersii Skay4041]|uniref:Glycoside hydrolase family 16 protein n=1 Tax=Amanita thiersii Skay4041 TaxID=703135 RepID=A0A2A9P1Y4_9AGAR|nr:glycoside hydrolase family 16 protein [Amanita thiersii Skay4041]